MTCGIVANFSPTSVSLCLSLAIQTNVEKSSLVLIAPFTQYCLWCYPTSSKNHCTVRRQSIDHRLNSPTSLLVFSFFPICVSQSLSCVEREYMARRKCSLWGVYRYKVFSSMILSIFLNVISVSTWSCFCVNLSTGEFVYSSASVK